MSLLPDRLICLVTDRRQLSPDARTTRDEVAALEAWLDNAIGGVDVIQIRERDLEAGALVRLASAVRQRAEGTATRVVVNDRADVAEAARAAGVHLRADGPPIDRVRAIGPADWIVGRSVHTVDDARRHASADYLIFGTVFGGGSKGDAAPTTGLDALRTVAAASRAPIIAIGGVDPARAAQCIEAGARGVAAIGLFLPPGRAPLAKGITRAVQELRAVLQRQKAEGTRQK